MNSEIKQQADLFIESIRAYRRSAIISPNERDATISAIWGCLVGTLNGLLIMTYTGGLNNIVRHL
jgi:hypothetical protein